MQFIETFQVNDKNTRQVNTQKGLKLVSSVKAYPFEHYIGNIWLPPVVKFGDYVTVYIDQVEKEEKDGKTYYNAKFPNVTPLFNLNQGNSAQTFDDPNGGMEPSGDPFSQSQPMNISDDDLPF